MLSKCIKMPKYSFKRYLFFAIWGGHLLSLAYLPHLTCITSAAPCIVSAAPRILSALLRIVLTAQKYDEKHLVNIKFNFFLTFSKVKKIFFFFEPFPQQVVIKYPVFFLKGSLTPKMYTFATGPNIVRVYIFQDSLYLLYFVSM